MISRTKKLFSFFIFFSLLQMQSPAHAAMTFPVPELLQNSKQETSYALTSILSLFAGKQLFTTFDKKTAASIMIGMAILYGCYNQYKHNSFSRFFANDIKGLKNIISNTTINLDSLGSAVSTPIDYGIDRIPLCPTIVKEALKTILHYFGSRLGTYVVNNKICVGGALLLHFAGRAVVNQSIADAGAGILFAGGCLLKYCLSPVEKKIDIVGDKVETVQKNVTELKESGNQHHKELLEKGEKNKQYLEKTIETSEQNIRKDLQTVSDNIQLIWNDLQHLKDLPEKSDQQGEQIEKLSHQFSESMLTLTSLIQKIAIVSQNDKDRDGRIDETVALCTTVHKNLIAAKTEFNTLLEAMNAKLQQSSIETQQGFNELKKTIEFLRNENQESLNQMNNKLDAIGDTQISQGQALNHANERVIQLCEKTTILEKLMVSIKQVQVTTLESSEKLEQQVLILTQIVGGLSEKSSQYLSMIETLKTTNIQQEKILVQLVSVVEKNQKDSEKIAQNFFDELSQRVNKVEKKVDDMDIKVSGIYNKVDDLTKGFTSFKTDLPDEIQRQLQVTLQQWQAKYEEDRKKQQAEHEEQIKQLTNKINNLIIKLEQRSNKIEEDLTEVKESVVAQQQTMHTMGTAILQEVKNSNNQTLLALQSSQGNPAAPSVAVSWDEGQFNQKQKPLPAPKIFNKSSSSSSKRFS